jgi:hypothetical protein
MRGWLIFVLAALGLGASLPLAVTVANMLFRSETVTFTASDGVPRQAVIGPRAPRPSWIALPDDAALRGGGYFPPSPETGGAESGAVEFTTALDPEALLRFYGASLEPAGFVVTDRGLGGLDPGTAAMLAVQGGAEARHPDGRLLFLTMRTGSGPRLIQIGWRGRNPG